MSTDTADDRPWDDIGWLTSGRFRHDVLEELADGGPATPSELEDELGHHIASVSHALAGLRERGYVELLVPEDRRKGRIYGATEAGEQLLTHATEVSR